MKPFLFFRTLILLIIMLPAAGQAQWTLKSKLSSHAMKAMLNESMGQCLAASGDTLHVVWSDKRISGSSIWYKRSIDTGLTWSVEVPISDTNSTADFSAVAVSGNTVHVVWRDSSLGHYASFYRRSADGGNTWSTSYCLDSNTLFWPGIAAKGSLVVVSLNKGVFGNTYVAFKRSVDNGTTWDTVKTISTRTGPGRSEDPAINTDGHYVHLSWNDNRSGIMDIYYRRSIDMGVTWDPEIRVVHGGVMSYTTMVCLNNSNVDIACADRRTGNYDIYLAQSHSYGATFDTVRHITSDTATEAYPYVVRDSNNLYMVYYKFNTGNSSTPMYIHSADGGITWSTAYQLGTGAQPFVVLTCPVLHVIWPDSGSIYYRRNPVADTSCLSTLVNINKIISKTGEFKVYPNPATTTITISSQNSIGNVIICNSIGERVYYKKINSTSEQIDITTLPNGIYILSIEGRHLELLKE